MPLRLGDDSGDLTSAPRREICVGVAGISVSVATDDPRACFAIPQFVAPFSSAALPHVCVRVHFGDLPELTLGATLFASGGVWSLHRSGDKQVIILRAPGPAAPAYGLAVFDPDFRSGDVYFRDEAADLAPFYPLGYPLDELLMVNLLAQGRGVLLHALGCRMGDHGAIFAGVSGAGKSTLARLWAGQPDVTLLSDDRVVVRRQDGRFWVYGTPWCGDAQAASPEGAPLERIFVLRQARENRAVLLEPMEAATRLLVRSFPTFWSAEGMEFTLKTLGDLTQAIPCYELGFLPDASLVEYVRCLT